MRIKRKGASKDQVSKPSASFIRPSAAQLNYPDQQTKHSGGLPTQQFINSPTPVASSKNPDHVIKNSTEKSNVSVSYTTVGKVIHDRHGYFFWKVLFQTTGKNGWIVQRIQNEYEATKPDGSPDPHTPTREYWEAWKVDENSVISPSNLNAHDKWQRGYEGSGGIGTTGSFSMKGDIYFTQKDITKQGFVQNSVPDAANLHATTKKPKGLGEILVSRFANGKWDSRNGKLEHSGTHG